MRNKFLLVDEATASVDLETDVLVQKTIGSKFSESTVLTIAHRRETLETCDKILEVKDGKVRSVSSVE